MRVGLAANQGEEKAVMRDATDLKAHRAASGIAVKKRDVGVPFGAPWAA